MNYLKPIISWLIALWAAKIFLFSLPYKFTKHPDTEHIFGTIGQWIGETINGSLGELFSGVGSYAVGTFELLASVILLLPALSWILNKMGIGMFSVSRERFHAIGGLLSSAVMAGAVFFHLFTPLGIEVLHDGKNDGGSLFYAALSILILGVVLFFINRSGLQRVNRSAAG